jgi:hypothetical protein
MLKRKQRTIFSLRFALFRFNFFASFRFPNDLLASFLLKLKIFVWISNVLSSVYSYTSVLREPESFTFTGKSWNTVEVHE